MREEIRFEGFIQFKGSINEFNQLMELQKKGPGSIAINTVPVPDREWWPWRLRGIPPFPEALLSAEVKEILTKDMPRIKLIDGIDGGIRDPHFHMRDGVTLINESKMKEMLGKIASEL